MLKEDVQLNERAAPSGSKPISGSKSRLSWIDIAKGLAIILVVYGHCLRGLTTAGIISSNAPIQITDYIIYTTHMPLFFVASGLFFARSYERSSGQFWRMRLLTIVYPYFLWSVIQGVVQIVLSGSGATNRGMDWERLTSILWWPISPFWFLYALFFSNLLAVMLVRIKPEVITLLALVAFLSSYYLAGQVIQDVTYGFLYFSLGMVLSKRDYTSQVPASWLHTGALVLTFIAVAILSYTSGIPERLPVIAAMVGIAAFASLGSFLERSAGSTWIAKTLKLCGQCSMGIFVLHILVLGFVRTVLVKFLHLENTYLLLTIGTALGVLIPLAVQLAAIRLGVNQLAGLPASAITRPRNPAPAL